MVTFPIFFSPPICTCKLVPEDPVVKETSALPLIIFPPEASTFSSTQCLLMRGECEDKGALRIIQLLLAAESPANAHWHGAADSAEKENPLFNPIL